MAASSDWPWQSLAEAAAAVKAGAVSPMELTRACLERIERVDRVVHAFVSVDAQGALQDAAKAEREIKAGHYRSPLHGIPIGLKDNCDATGVATRNGSRVFADRMPTQDATTWARLREAGAMLLGKTTMSEAAWGVDFPPVRNPWDVRRNPGLSSGGSGAAVAAGLCFMAMGSDTGGSIRIPAGLSGVVGLKATYGRVSRAGVMPHTWSLDHAGPLSRRVEDAALVLGLIAGHDPRDSASASVPVGDYLADLKKGVRGMRIGVPREHFWDRIEGRVATVVRQALHDLEAAGAKLTEVSIPHMPTALGAILVTEMASVTAWHDKYLKQPERRAKYTPEVRALMDAGQPEHVLHACWRFTYPWNLTGLPALSVPCGFAAELPVGLQLVGRPFDEATILRAGHAYQEATRWHERRPPDPVARAG